jgi:parallel beta-helix repeat protein
LGDLAPRGATDGQLTAGDLVILQRILFGDIVPTADELLIGDVSPPGLPDYQINASDLMILQRAVLGEITLGTVNIATTPPAPQLDPVALSPTNENPYAVSGTSVVDASIEIYLNGTLVATTTATASGTFSTSVVLAEGWNAIQAAAIDNGVTSPLSTAINVEFQLADGAPLTGNVSGMTLAANTRYLVDAAGITVSTVGLPLVIEHGARLEFPPGSGITVSGWNGVSGGAIQVNGLPEVPAVFTSSLALPTPGDWKGIEIKTYSTTNIDNAIIEYAVNGIYFNNTDNGGTKYGGSVTNSVIRYNTNGVNVFGYATPVLTANRIYSNTIGVKVNGEAGRKEARPLITDGEIYSNDNWNYHAINTPLNSTGSTPTTLFANNNWWGSDDPVEIAATIHDTFDPVNPLDPSDTPALRPFVDFSGFLDAPGGASKGEIMPPHVTYGATKTFNGGKVYVVGDMHVYPDATLIINAGTQVLVMGYYKINIAYDSSASTSTFQVNGTASEPVTFGSTLIPAQPGDWQGIIVGAKNNMVINHAVIEHATTGISFYNSNVNGIVGGSLSNSTLTNNIDAVEIYATSSPTISNNSLYNNKRAIYIHSTYGESYGATNTFPVINNNQIYNNTEWNIFTENLFLTGNIGNNPGYINARNNWWGTTDPRVIPNTLYDYFDTGVSVTNPVIDFSQALDGPMGNPLSLYVYETFNSDAVFSGNVYLFGNNVFSAANVLTISPGTNLYFYANARLDVYGNVSAAGSIGNEISFLPMEAVYSRGYWGGIKFIGPGQTVNVDYCVAMGAVRAFEFENSDGNLSNCYITENMIGLYLISDSGPTLSNDTITNNDTGIYLNGSDRAPAVNADPHPTIINSGIYDNTNYNLVMEGVLDVSGIVLNNIWWGTTELAVIKSKIQTIYWNTVSDSTLQASISTTINNSSAFQGFAVDHAYISPAVSPGIKDSATITGTFSGAPDWAIEIRNAANSVVKTYSGTNTAVNISWSGKNQSEVALGDGIYSVNIRNNAQLVGRKTVYIDNTSPEAIISGPSSGVITEPDAVSVAIIGTAQDTNFESYQLLLADGVAPAAEDYQALEPVTTIAKLNTLLYNWIVNDIANGYQEASGEYTLKLTVLDKAGNTSTQTINITLGHLSITDVSYGPQVIIPDNSEVATVNFTIGGPAAVELRIYDEKKYKQGESVYGVSGWATAPGETLYRTIAATYSAAGSYSLTWDGRDDNGQVVPAEAYRFELFAYDGQVNNTYAIPVSSVALSDPTVATVGITKYEGLFDWTKNDNVKYAVTVLPGHIVRLYSAVSGYYVPLPDTVMAINTILEEGSHVVAWDGRGSNKKIVFGQTGITTPGLLYELSPNTIYIKKKSPIIKGIYASPDIEVKSNPYAMSHSYDQVSEIQYTIDEKSYVTVKLLPPCSTLDDNGCTADANQPAAITLVDNALLDADNGSGQLINHSFSWHGYDYQSATPDTNNILVSTEGYYTYYIEATSYTTGRTTTYRGTLRLLY